MTFEYGIQNGGRPVDWIGSDLHELARLLTLHSRNLSSIGESWNPRVVKRTIKEIISISEWSDL